MLSFLYKIKNNIRDKLKNKHTVSRTRQYEVVTGSNRMLDHKQDQDDENNDTITMFRAKIDKKTVKGDYELQALLRIINIHSIHIEDLILEPRYEEAIRNIPGASDILKIKMRLLYIMKILIKLKLHKRLLLLHFRYPKQEELLFILKQR